MKQHIVELEGRKMPLRFELFDWAQAEADLGVALLPFGETPFWQKAGLAQNASLLYVGLRHAWPGLTLDRIFEVVTWENHAAVAEILQAALTDFFRRLRPEAPEVAASESTPDSTGTSLKPSADSISDSAPMSSGA